MSTHTLSFSVIGVPAPQGSKRGFTREGTTKVQMVESSKKVKPWRADVKQAAREAIEAADWPLWSGPVRVRILFMLKRPDGHYGTGRNADLLKPSSPEYPALKPDLDKLARSTLDALTSAGAYSDDSRVVALEVEKAYALRGSNTGALIHVTAQFEETP